MRPTEDTPGGQEPEPRAPPQPDAESAGTATGRVRSRVEQARVGAEEAKRKLEEAKRKVEEAAPRHAALDTGLKSIRTDRALAGSLLGGAMAFRLFLWIVPATLVFVGGFGIAATTGDPAELGDDVGLSVRLAESIAENSTTGSVVALIVGAAGLWWGGIGAYKALRTIHQLAWRLPVTPGRAAWKGGLWFTAATIVALALGGFVNRLRADAAGIGILLTVLFVLVYATVSFAASVVLPHRDVPTKALIPGAVLFGIGVEVLHIATVFYFAGRIAHASDIYGPLGVAVGLLVWLYVLGRLTVAAPVLNATLAARGGEPNADGTAVQS